jgi:hypothetical protein
MNLNRKTKIVSKLYREHPDASVFDGLDKSTEGHLAGLMDLWSGGHTALEYEEFLNDIIEKIANSEQWSHILK